MMWRRDLCNKRREKSAVLFSRQKKDSESIRCIISVFLSLFTWTGAMGWRNFLANGEVRRIMLFSGGNFVFRLFRFSSDVRWMWNESYLQENLMRMQKEASKSVFGWINFLNRKIMTVICISKTLLRELY